MQLILLKGRYTERTIKDFMNYEIQIYSKDKTKIIRFKDQEEGFQLNNQMAWEDFYYAMGSVIDEKPDKIREKDTLIGRLDVKDIPYEQIVDIMCEDLSPELTRILTNEKEVCEVDINE